MCRVCGSSIDFFATDQSWKSHSTAYWRLRASSFLQAKTKPPNHHSLY